MKRGINSQTYKEPENVVSFERMMLYLIWPTLICLIKAAFVLLMKKKPLQKLIFGSSSSVILKYGSQHYVM